MSGWTLIFPSLAQAAAEPGRRDLGTATWSLAILLVVVLAAFMIAGIVIYIVRSRTMKADATQGNIPLTLSEIRRMHRDGEIDDDEMQRLKGIVTAQTRKDLAKPLPEKKE